jgi:predicted MFS family arabinose efflux permease
MGANELVLVVYGAWMEASFGLALTSLGLATAVIGGAEIAGELTIGVMVDRLGKRPVIIATGLLTGIMYFALPFSSTVLTSALISLFILFLFFEMTVVGGVPLMTELVPAGRAVVMSVVLAAGGLGRGLGALLGPALWTGGDLRLLATVAAVIMLLAVVILALWIKEAPDGEQESGIGGLT